MKASKITVLAFFSLIIYATLVDVPIALENILKFRHTEFQKMEAFLKETEGPQWYKAGKDVLLLAALWPIFVHSTLKPQPLRVHKRVFRIFAFLIGTITLVFLITLAKYGPVVALIGLRSFTSIFAFLIGAKLSALNFYYLAHIVGSLTILESLIAIIQQIMGRLLLTGAWVYRSTGTFFNPNALALFGLSAIIIFSTQRGLRYKYFYIMNAVIIIITSGSRVGMMGMCIWYYIYKLFSTKSVYKRGMILTTFIPMIAISVYTVQYIAGRDTIQDQIRPDSGNRLGILMDYVEKARVFDLVFGVGLGIGSNTLNTIDVMSDDLKYSEAASDTFITDSTFTATLVQGGIILLCSVMAFILSIISSKNQLQNDYSVRVGLVIIMLLVSVGNMINEASPFNYIVFALYGYLARVEVCKKVLESEMR